MRANVVVTVHSINVLSAEQTGELSMLLITSFAAGVSFNTDKNTATVSLTTNDIQSVFRLVESLTIRLAASYHPDLWTSVSIGS